MSDVCADQFRQFVELLKEIYRRLYAIPIRKYLQKEIICLTRFIIMRERVNRFGRYKRDAGEWHDRIQYHLMEGYDETLGNILRDIM